MTRASLSIGLCLAMVALNGCDTNRSAGGTGDMADTRGAPRADSSPDPNTAIDQSAHSDPYATTPSNPVGGSAPQTGQVTPRTGDGSDEDSRTDPARDGDTEPLGDNPIR